MDSSDANEKGKFLNRAKTALDNLFHNLTDAINNRKTMYKKYKVKEWIEKGYSDRPINDVEQSAEVEKQAVDDLLLGDEAQSIRMSPPFLPGQISIEQIIDSRKPDPEEMLENLGFGSSEDNDDIKKRLPPRFHQTDVIESPTPVELDNDPENVYRSLGLAMQGIIRSRKLSIEENTSLVRSVKRTSKKGKTFESILHPLNAEYLASVGYYDSTSSGSPSPTNIIPPLLKNYQQQSFDLEEIDSVHERSKLTRDPSMQSEQSSGFIDSQEFSREPFAKPETEIIEACNTQVLENKKTNKIRVSSSFEKKKDFQSIIHSTIKSYSNQLESIHQRWKNLCTKVQDDVDLSKEFKDLDSIKEKIREQIRLCESLLRKDVNDECIPICVALLKEQIYEASILATFEGCTISENKECLDVLKDLTCLESGQTSSYTNNSNATFLMKEKHSKNELEIMKLVQRLEDQLPSSVRGLVIDKSCSQLPESA